MTTRTWSRHGMTILYWFVALHFALGAATLMFVLTGAITTHIINRDGLSESWAAPTYLVISGVLALVNWPADWRHLLRTRPATTPGM